MNLSDVFKNKVKVKGEVKLISSFFRDRFSRRVDHKPYYQRNYVWDNKKASYFIETIIIGSYVPPIIACQTEDKNNGGVSKKIEIIDGRQRFETLKRFHENKFKLKGTTLEALKSFEGMFYSELPEDIKNKIGGYLIRMETFIIDSTDMSENVIDTIKKEIFFRYNSGITKLNKSEINNAKFIDLSSSEYLAGLLKVDRNLDDALTILMPSFLKESKDNQVISVKNKIQQVMVNGFSNPVNIINLNDKIHELITGYIEDNVDYKELCDEIFVGISWLRTVNDLLNNIEGFNLQPLINFRILSMMALYNNININENDESIFDIKSKRSVFVITEEFTQFIIDNRYLWDGIIGAYDRELFSNQVEILGRFLNEAFLIKSDGLEKIGSFEKNKSNVEYDLDHYINNIPPDPTSISVEDLQAHIKEEKLVIRPPYQRGEKIDINKSSSIIESMILKLPLPTIFLYKRKDGVSEVIDGQQRIISILGFLDSEYRDAFGSLQKTKNSNYKLKNLSLLREYEGLGYDDIYKINEDIEDDIYDYTLNVVIIDERKYPDFKPVDLFVRLNDKPYTIAKDSFEMWNAKAPKEVTDIYKNIAIQNPWFFYRDSNQNKRMRNEEMLVNLSYFIYNDRVLDRFTQEFYLKSNKIVSRNKKGYTGKNITEFIEGYDQKSIDINFKACEELSSIILKIKTLFKNSDINKEFFGMMGISSTKSKRKPYKTSYILLFHLLKDVSLSSCRNKSNEIIERVSEIFEYIYQNQSENLFGLFGESITQFFIDYNQRDRCIVLKEHEKQEMLKNQNYKCGISGEAIRSCDSYEIDHKIPLALGGNDTYDNLHVVLKHQNRKKSSNQIS